MHADAHLGILHHRFDRRKSAVAENELRSLLTDARTRLSALGNEPMCVLECPRRLNKGVANWRAARVGSDSAYSYVDERVDTSLSVWRDAPTELREANAILQGLIDRSWRPLVFAVFDFNASLETGTALALLVEQGKTMLAVQLEYDSEGPIYEIGSETSFGLIGVCERLGELSGVRPIEWIASAAWAQRQAQIVQ